MTNKFYDHKTFKITEDVTIYTKTQDTNYGFRHMATLFKNSRELKTVKCCYYNRTWESFKYESVIKKLAKESKALTEVEKQQIKSFDNTVEDLKPFKMLNVFMKITDLMNDKPEDLKTKNESKLRMIQATTGKENLTLPDDWESLPEAEKAGRLAKIQNML